VLPEHLCHNENEQLQDFLLDLGWGRDGQVEENEPPSVLSAPQSTQQEGAWVEEVSHTVHLSQGHFPCWPLPFQDGLRDLEELGR
jgi:hypothetical protein